MSEQSDAIFQILRDSAEKAKNDSDFLPHQEVLKGLIEAHCESAPAAYKYYGKYSRNQARKHFRHWAGHSDWDSADAALEGTIETAKHFILPIFHAAFADGLQLGHGVGHLIRKFRWFHEEGKLYSNDSFRQESSLLMMAMLSDYDTAEMFEREMATASRALADGTGFTQMDAEEANANIYDLWALIGMGAFTHMFATGQIYGKQMHDLEHGGDQGAK